MGKERISWEKKVTDAEKKNVNKVVPEVAGGNEVQRKGKDFALSRQPFTIWF